jgi:hypothetical protein
MAGNQGTRSDILTDVVNLGHDPANVCVVAHLKKLDSSKCTVTLYLGPRVLSILTSIKLRSRLVASLHNVPTIFLLSGVSNEDLT